MTPENAVLAGILALFMTHRPMQPDEQTRYERASLRPVPAVSAPQHPTWIDRLRVACNRVAV
jgi:hypothetical protein